MNNYIDWCMHYNHVLRPYYLEFIQLFERGMEPTYEQFLNYCYANTEKTMRNGILTAYLSPFA